MASRDGDATVSQLLASRMPNDRRSFYPGLIFSDRRAVQRALKCKHHFPHPFDAAAVASPYDTAQWIVSVPIGKAINAPAKSPATPPHRL